MNNPAVRMMVFKEARECADRINAGINNVRRDVLELHDRDGWSALGYKSWTECVQREFKQAERYIFYQFKAGKIEQNLNDSAKSNCTIVQLGSIPEGQLRPLARLEPDQQREAWQKAVETAPEGKVTAAHVAKIVDQVKPKIKDKPVFEKELVSEDFQNAFDNMVIELKNAAAMNWQTTSYKGALEMIMTLLAIIENMGG